MLNPGTSKTMFGHASDETPQGSVQSYIDGLPFFMTGYYLYLNTPGFQDFGRNPFTENTAAGVPTTHQNQIGGSIGGRIIRDKLSFFGDAQLTRNLKGGSILTSVPTAAERNGNLGDWLAQGSQYQTYDPGSDQSTGVGRTPFTGNVILPSRHSPQAILNYFPLRNTGGPNAT